VAGKDNLTPFTKDDNRAAEAGRKSKRGPSLIDALKKVFQEAKENDTDLAPKKFMAEIAQKCKKKGDAALLRLMLEYMEGKVPDKIEADVTTKEDINIKIVD
jgi:hypothetical protein